MKCRILFLGKIRKPKCLLKIQRKTKIALLSGPVSSRLSVPAFIMSSTLRHESGSESTRKVNI